MKKLIISGVLCCVLGMCCFSCKPQETSKEEIVSFVNDFERKIEYLDRQTARYSWESYIKGKADSLDAIVQLTGAYLSDPHLLNTARHYRTLINDKGLQRKLDLIYNRCLRYVIDNNDAVAPLILSLKDRYGDNSVLFEGSRYARHQLREMMGRQANSQRRQAMYTALMKVDEAIAKDVIQLARKRNHTVGRLGYNSYYDLMLAADGIDPANLNRILVELENISEDPYRRALDSLRQAKGLSELAIHDIEYACYSTETETDAYFGVDSQFIILQSTLRGLGVRISDQPIYTDVSIRPLIGSEILTVHIPDDVRVPLNLDSGTPSIDRLFSQFGKALYAVNIDPQDYLLNSPPAPCFNEAMGTILSGMTETKSWKRKYAGMPEPLVIETTANENLRRLYTLRTMLLAVAFERALYGDPFADIDQVYAGLFEKYMLLQPDGNLLSIWATETDLVEYPVSRQNRLYAECMAAQTFHYLTEKYGSVLDNQHTREFLVQNFYRFGGVDYWEMLLSRGTGEKLNPKYYIEFPYD